MDGTGGGLPAVPLRQAGGRGGRGAFWAGCCAPGGWCLAGTPPLGWPWRQRPPRGGMWAAVLGAMLGYIAPSPVYVPLRYAAALLAVAAIRWSLSELPGVNSHPPVRPGGGLSPPAPHRDDHGVSKRLYGLFRGAVRSGVLSGGGLRGTFSSARPPCSWGPQGDGAPAGRPGPAPTAPGGGRRGGSHPSPPGSWCCPSPSSPSGGSPWGGSPWCSWCCTAPGWGASAAGRCPGWPPGVILGAVHRRALLPLRGLWLGRADGRGFRPHGQAGGGPGLYRVPRGWPPCRWALGTPGCSPGPSRWLPPPLLYMALPSSRRLTELFGFRKDTLSGSALRGNIILRLRYAAQALTNVYDSVEEISQKLSQVCAPHHAGGVRPLGGDGVRRLRRKHPVLAKEKGGHPGELFPAHPGPAGEGPGGE